MLDPFRRKPVATIGTRRYPDAADETPPTFRGHPFLLDHACCGTGDCARACPTAALSVTRQGEADGWTWRLDRAACTGCGLCIEACPLSALVASRAFELAARSREDLVVSVTFSAARAGRDGRVSQP